MSRGDVRLVVICEIIMILCGIYCFCFFLITYKRTSAYINLERQLVGAGKKATNQNLGDF